MTPTALVLPLRTRDGSVCSTALIDAEDEALADFTWRLHATGYAFRGARIGGRYHAIWLHRVILGLVTDGGGIADHIDQNKLDNRRENLRVLPSRAENNQNVPGHVNASSRHRGVCWVTAKEAWLAHVTVGKKLISGGYFASEERAAVKAAELRAKHLPYSKEAHAA